jgi:hypothetical protein
MFNWHGVRSDAAVYQRLSPDAQQAAAHGGRGDLRPEQQETRRQVPYILYVTLRYVTFRYVLGTRTVWHPSQPIYISTYW